MSHFFFILNSIRSTECKIKSNFSERDNFKTSQYRAKKEAQHGYAEIMNG